MLPRPQIFWLGTIHVEEDSARAAAALVRLVQPQGVVLESVPGRQDYNLAGSQPVVFRSEVWEFIKRHLEMGEDLRRLERRIPNLRSDVRGRLKTQLRSMKARFLANPLAAAIYVQEKMFDTERFMAAKHQQQEKQQRAAAVRAAAPADEEVRRVSCLSTTQQQPMPNCHA